MKVLLALSVVLFSHVAQSATTYDINLKIFKAGKLVYSPRLIIPEGQAGLIESDEYFVEVLTNSGAKMDFVVGINASNGERTLVAGTHINATPGVPFNAVLGNLTSPFEKITLQGTVK